MKAIIFRLDYGGAFGGGHLKRALSISRKTSSKITKIFNIQVHSQKNIISCKKIIETELKKKKIQINFYKNFSLEYELSIFSQKLKKYNLIAAVFDFSNYEKIKKKKELKIYFKKLNKIKEKTRLLLIDSLGDESLTNNVKYNIDILVTPYFGAKKNHLYSKHFFGSKYFVLNTRKIKKKILEREIVKNILISTGQSDHKKIMLKVLLSLNNYSYYFSNIKFNLIIGNDFKINYIKKIKKFITKKKLSIKLIYNCKDLSPHILKSDIGIVSSGLTKYEFNYYGKVPLVISFDNLSHKLQKKFQLANCSFYIGEINKLKKNLIFKKIKKLIENFSLRKKIVNNGAKLLDGYGAQRIIKLVLNNEK